MTLATQMPYVYAWVDKVLSEHVVHKHCLLLERWIKRPVISRCRNTKGAVHLLATAVAITCTRTVFRACDQAQDKSRGHTLRVKSSELVKTIASFVQHRKISFYYLHASLNLSPRVRTPLSALHTTIGDVGGMTVLGLLALRCGLRTMHTHVGHASQLCLLMHAWLRII